MVATTIHSKSGLYYASVKDYVDDTTHVFRSFKRIKREKAKKNGGESETRRVETYEITLEDWVIDNLNEAYMVPVDFQAYKKLRRPIAKAIFHLLHLWFFASGGKPVEKEYGSLCQRLNIRKYPYETKIRASIGQALDDLEKLGYLKSWSLEKMLTKRDAFKVVMEAGPALIQSLDQNRRRALPGTEEEVEGETAALIAGRLRRLGVSKAKIESYVAQPEEILAQLVDKIEYIDHLLSNKKSGIKNPGGFTVHFIDTGEAIPETFITKRQRQKAQLELKNKLMREAQNTAFYQAYEEWKQERIDRYIDTNFKPEEFDQLLKEKLPLVYEQHPNVRRMQMAERIRQARVFVRREIGETINLPTFEEWVKTKEVDEIEDIMQPLLFQ